MFARSLGSGRLFARYTLMLVISRYGGANECDEANAYPEIRVLPCQVENFAVVFLSVGRPCPCSRYVDPCFHYTVTLCYLYNKPRDRVLFGRLDLGVCPLTISDHRHNRTIAAILLTPILQPSRLFLLHFSSGFLPQYLRDGQKTLCIWTAQS